MWTAERAVAELRRRGELRVPASGLVTLRGDVLELYRGVDAALRALALRTAAEEWLTAPALPLQTLGRADYFASFPQWLTVASHLSDDPARLERVATAADPAAAVPDAVDPPRAALQPALCYHIYDAYAGRTLAAPVCVTCAGTCWRHEADRHAPLERGWSFTMREIVCIADDAAVTAFLAEQRAGVVIFARRLGLEPAIDAAEDPFFAPTARGRALLQRVRGLKDELLLTLGGRMIAAASFNNHDRFFGNAFDITAAEGGAAVTGCVAFGIERWLLALLVAHGPDARTWPDPTAALGRAVRPVATLTHSLAPSPHGWSGSAASGSPTT